MKRYHHHAKKTTLAAMVALALFSTGVFAAELPVSGEVVAGRVTVGGTTYLPVGAEEQKVYINPATGQTFKVVGNSVIDWSSFDIGSGNALTFEGEGSNYILNRVSGSSASEIYGRLNTQNIHFILANPNGITVGNGAQLNVIDGGSILLAAMRNTSNDSITLFNRGYGNTSTINIGGDVAVNGNVTLMAKTINVADGITFSGDTALKLLAGETLYNQPITVTPGEGVDSIGSSGSITFNGSLVDDSHKVNLGVSADTITMLADEKIALTGTDSAVNINTSSLQNADITAPEVTVIRNGSIEVSNSQLTAVTGDVKVLSGTLSEDGTTLSPYYSNWYTVEPASQVTLTNSSLEAKKDVIAAGSGVAVSGQKGESPAIKATENVMVAAGKVLPLYNGTLERESANTAAVTVSNAEIQGDNVTIAGAEVIVSEGAALTAVHELGVAAEDSITLKNGKAVSGITYNRSFGNLTVNNATLRGETVKLLGAGMTVNAAIGTAETEAVSLRSDARTLKVNGGTISGQNVTLTGTTVDVATGGTISGQDITLTGTTVDVATGAAITAVGENGVVRLLAGSGVTNGVVTATSGNKATVKGTLSGGDIVVAGGAVAVDGGTVDAGTNSAWLLAGNSIKTTAATGSANADEVITSAEGNAVTIKNGAAVSADKVHIAGYSADLSSATNSSSVTAATEINAVTGSTINNNAGTLVRKADAPRGRFSRDTASVVTVKGSASSAMIDMPTDGRVISGSVSYKGNSYDASSNYYFNLASGDTITANSHSIINWNTFDIGLSGVLNFDTTNGALLNRVTGSYASWLQGTLNHTGTYPLLLVNPQGIHVYKGATINGANLILSGLNMTGTAFDNFVGGSTLAFDTTSTGDVKVDTGVTFTNRSTDKLSLVGKNVDVDENNIVAQELKADATNTATLTNLAYTGALEGNSVLGSEGGSLILSGGSYTGNTNLKGTMVNMAVTSHTGDVTVQGTNVGINGGTYTGNMNLAGTSVSVSGATFNGENKVHDLTLSGLGENGAVTVSNSTVTGADDVVLTGKTVNVSQSGNRANWTAETFTLGKRESASNTTGITNINLTVTKENTTPTVENDVTLTLSNTAISAPKINLTPASLTLSGGSSLISDTTVDIAAAGSVTVQGGSEVTAETGDLNVTAAGVLTVKGGSILEAKTGDLTAKGALVAIGVANDTENTIKADAGIITIKAGEDDGRTDANTVHIQNTDLTADAAGKSITVTGYSVDAAGDLYTKTANMSGNSVNTAGTIEADTVNITGTASASASGTITAGTVNMSGADSVSASGNITAGTLNITGISATGSLTVGGVVRVDNALTLQGGSSGGAVINGAITAPSIKISAQDVTFSGANVMAATGDVSVTGKTIRTNESYYTSSAINSKNSDVLLISGTNTAGVYTTTEGGSISADKMNITGNTVTALARNTTINNGTIHANNMQIAAANTVNGSTWEAGFGDTDNPNNLTLTNTTVLSKNGESAIENVKLAGSNVTFGGGGTDAQAFKANSLAVASDQSITVASGQVNVTGAAGISLSGKSITVDGTIQARQINLTATENDATLNSGSALNATGVDAANAISIKANNGNINANGSLTADDSITMNAKTGIATAGNITADSVSLAAGNDINSAADITASTITMDGGDGKAISATGALNAAGGTITLGHAPSDEQAKAGTKTVTIGPAAGANKAVKAQTVNVHATDTIGLSRVTMETADSLNLASKEVSITGSSVTIEGSLTLNGTEDAANPSVSITGSTLAGTAINATGKGISVGSSDLTATTGGIAVNSTGENDIAVTNTALKAEHATNGNISINSGKAIQAIGGSMTAGKDISLAAIAAKGGEDSDAAYAIKASANMTAGNDIGLTATAGEVYSAGSLTATSGSITMDSADGSKIVATGDMKAENGSITLGHSTGDAAKRTREIEIGPSNTKKIIKAQSLNVNATDSIYMQNVDAEITGASGLDLSSNGITIRGSQIKVNQGDLNLEFSSYASNSDWYSNLVGAILLATDTTEGEGNIAITAHGAIDSRTSTIEAAGNIMLDASDGTYINSGYGSMTAHGGNIILQAKTSPTLLGASTSTDAIRVGDKVTAENGEISLSASAGDIHIAYDNSNSGVYGKGLSAVAENGRVVVRSNVTANQGDIVLKGTCEGDEAIEAFATMNASGKIDMEATNGEIRIGATQIANEVTALAKNGDITVSGTVTAPDITLTAGEGNNKEKSIILDEYSNLNASNIVTANAIDGTINANGNITVKDANNNKAGTVTLTAATVSVGDAEDSKTADNRMISAGQLSVNAPVAINVNKSAIDATSELYFSSKNILVDNSRIRSVGNVSLTAETVGVAKSDTTSNQYGLTSVDGNINLRSTVGNITLDKVDLTSNSSTSGNGNITVTSAKDVNVTEGSMTANKNIDVIAEDGNVTSSANMTSTNGNITLDGKDSSTIEATGILQAENGSVTFGHLPGTEPLSDGTAVVSIGNNVTANKLNVYATDSIGVKNANITVADTAANGLTLSSKEVAVTDSTIINNGGAVTIASTALDKDVTLTNTVLQAENNTNGKIAISSAKAIGATGGSMIAGKDITLTATDGITVSSGLDAGQDIALMAGTSISASGDMDAGRAISLKATGGYISVAGNTLTAGGKVDLLAGSTGDTGWSATENNALGLTNITLNAAGAVTAKSGKTDIATSRITADGNVNVTAVGTDGDASHVNLDKSTITGAGVAIRGKGINVDQKDGISENNSTITANTGDVTLTTDTNIAVSKATITAKGKADLAAATGIVVADTSVTATDKGISIMSTASDSDVTLTGVTLNAENATAGNIAVQTGKAISVSGTGSSMTAGKDIKLEAKNAGITVSGAALTTTAGNGGNIDLLAGSADGTGWSAIESNALGLTNVTFSAAGAVTGKSVKTDIATSSITAGGNVNVTAMGTDGDASHVNVDNSTIAGAGVAINGKGIKVDQAEMENNNSTITANTGDVTLTTDTDIAVSKAAIIAKGKADIDAVTGVVVADTSVTATDKGIAITSTTADSDVTLSSVTLKAENTVNGNITVQTGNAIGVTGGSMIAGKDITLNAENAGITVDSVALTTKAGNGGNIDLLAGSADGTDWSAIESNALGLTDVTLSAAGAVTGKSVKTDIATSSITAGGNVNVTTVGTDGDASHVNVDKSTIEGAGVAISGKGIQIDQAEMENNTSTIMANTGDVTFTTDTDIAVSKAAITAKGKADIDAVTGVVVADTSVTATDKGISITLTAADSDVTLTGVTLNAENATAGNIAVQTSKAISVSGTGSSMTAGKDITLKAENAGITVSDAALTTTAGNGGNIDLLAGSEGTNGWSAIENNALELTNITLNAAGAVTAKSGKTDIATSSITAGGNVNVTAVGTDGDASHVNVDKSTIVGAGVAISGKGIKVDQAEMENNNSTITANAGDVALTTDTNIAVSKAAITAKGKTDLVAVNGINVADTSVTATDKGISITSTDSDVTLSSVTLKAENTANGNITVQTGDAIGVTGGSMTAGKNITLKAENAGITVSGTTLTNKEGNGGNIDLLAGSVDGTGWSATENNALGLTNVTLSGAGAVTGKSGKTDIATSSITAGGNVNVTAVGTDGDASHVNVDKSTIAGAGVAISGKGIKVDKKEGISENTSTITANTGDVTLTTDTNIAVNNANITAKGKADLVAATGINVADTGVTATDKGISIISTSDGKDVILTNTTLTATNATNGSITVRAKNAVNTKGSALTAGNDFTIGAGTGTNKLESSTLQGKNVNISGVGITVSKSEENGAAAPSVTATAGSVALNSTAGIGVSDASITATNDIGIEAVTAVGLENNKLQGKNVSISGKGITVSDDDAVTPTIKATAGGVTLASTGDGNDVTLTGATLKADNTTSGNITITSDRAIEATGGSMTAGENINLAATSSDGTAGAKAVNSSSDMTAGGNVRVASVAGDVVSSGNVAAANITIDGDNVSATGSLDAENGTITLGHAEGKGTGNVVIGEAADAAKVVKAANLNVHATDSIATRNANIAVANNVALASEAISLDGTALTTGGSLDIKGDTIEINASTLRTTNTSNGHINLLAGNADGADWSAEDGNTLALTNTDVSAAGDVSFRAGQITINADAENAPVKEIRGNNLLLAAAKSYDAENHKYTMESGQTISVTNTNLTGSDSITLLGYKTNIKGDVISKRLLGAVGESVTMNEDGSDVDDYIYTQEEGANVLTVDGAVATSDESDLIYIKLYGDAKFLNKNDTLQTMSFIANSPYSLAISGDMTVTAESGIRLASESIQIQDNLWANNPNASIELASAGGEMNISGNLRAGKDVILKSAQNIVIGTADKTVSVAADNGSVKLLAGNFDGRYGAQGEWVSANPAVNGIDLTNTDIAAGENIIVKGGAVNFKGNNELAGDASVLAGNAVLSGTVSGGENTLTMTADNIVVESGTQMTMHEFATRQGDFTLESAAQIRADETDLQGETISLANNSRVVSDAVKVKAENAELAGLICTDKLTAKADNTLTVTETVKNKAGTDDTIVELEGRNVTFAGSNFKTLTVKGTESITLDEGDLYGEDDIALTTKNLTVATNITTTNGDINLTGTENLRVTGSLTAGQQIGLNGKNIQLSGAKLNNGANAKTTVAGESAVITGTITTDTEADLSVKAQNVIVGDSGITNIAVSKFTVEGVEQAKFINTNFQADTTVKGKAAVLTGNIDATDYELTLQSKNVTIGDGQTATVMTAKSLADADNLTIDQAVLNLDSYKLQAGKAITLKNEVTAEGQALELAAPDASIGDGSANTVIKAGSVSATDKLLVDKAVLAVDDGTLQAQQIILRGNVTADNLDLTLQAPEAAIGDGIVDTVIKARSVMGTEDLLIDKASFAVTNPIIATAGNLTLQHEIVAGDTVGFQAGKAITMQGMSMDKSTDVSFEGKLIDMRDSSIDAGKDGKLFFAAYSVKTESPLSYTFQPDNEVIIDNSRLDAGEMTMLGYSIIARNGAEIYADKTLDALAAKKVAMGNLGNLEIVSRATMSTEPQNKLLQQDAIIEVGGRAYHNFRFIPDFRFIPASAYQSDTIMRYLESINVMPWQKGSDNSPLSIVGTPGLSLYRFQYQDGIFDAISGLEMYFTVEPHEGAVREEKEKTNE